MIAKLGGTLLLALGGILAVGALLVLGDAAAALFDRIRFGAGALLADAGLFLVIGLVLGVAGAGAMWIGLRLLGLLAPRSRR